MCIYIYMNLRVVCGSCCCCPPKWHARYVRCAGRCAGRCAQNYLFLKRRPSNTLYSYSSLGNKEGNKKSLEAANRGLPCHHLKQPLKNWVETLNHQGFPTTWQSFFGPHFIHGTPPRNFIKTKWAMKKNLRFFPWNTGWLIGILIMVYEIIPI